MALQHFLFFKTLSSFNPEATASSQTTEASDLVM